MALTVTMLICYTARSQRWRLRRSALAAVVVCIAVHLRLNLLVGKGRDALPRWLVAIVAAIILAAPTGPSKRKCVREFVIKWLLF